MNHRYILKLSCPDRAGIVHAVTGILLQTQSNILSSAQYGDPVAEDVKQARREQLMEAQQRISLEKNQAQVGRVLDVLVEGENDGISVGRSYRDAPEVDGLVIIDGEVPVGEMVPVRISGAMAYDLTGTVETAAGTIVL